jgi:predicted RND superfamily exporter protein
MTPTKRGLIARAITHTTRFSLDHPWTILGATFGLTIIAVLFITRLGLDTDLKSLLPQDYPSVTRLFGLRDRMGSQNDLIVEIRSPDPEANRRFGAAMASWLEARKDIRFVIYRCDKAVLERSVLLFLGIDQLEDLRARVIERIRREVRKQLRVDDAEPSDEPVDEVDDDPFERRKAATEPAKDEPHDAPTNAAKLGDDDLRFDEDALRKRFKQYDIPEYLTADEGRILVVKARPAFPSTEVQATRELVRDAQQAFVDLKPSSFHPEMTVSLQGFYADLTSQVDTLKSDVLGSTAYCMLALLLITAIYFRGLRPLILIFVPLVTSVTWALALAQILYGALNLVSAFIFAILLGLGIDFGIHMLVRLRSEMATRDWAAAFVETAGTTGVAVFTGAATTATVFFMLAFAQFKGFSQFGIIAGAGVLTSLLGSYTILPATYSVVERWLPWKPSTWVNLTGSALDRPVHRGLLWALTLTVVGSAVAFTAYSLAHLDDLEFEYDFSDVGVPEKPKVEKGQDFRDAVGRATTGSPAIVLADTAEDAEQVHRDLSGIIGTDRGYQLQVEAAPSPEYLPDDRMRDLAARYGMENLRILGRYLYKVFSLYSFIPEHQPEKLEILKDIRRRLEQKRSLFNGKDRENLDRFLEHVATEPLTPERLPEWIRAQFRDVQGGEGHVVIVWTYGSKENYINAKALKTALFDAKLPDARTVPVAANYFILADLIDTVKADAPWMLGGALCLISLLVFAQVRRVQGTLLAVVPLVVEIIWVYGVLYLIGMRLNFYNMIVLPLLIGMGIDGNVHVYARYHESGRGSLGRILRETGGAVFMAAFTTCIGFGGIFWAKHIGLNSMGTLAIAGITLCFFGASVGLPSLLWLLEQWRKPGPGPVNAGAGPASCPSGSGTAEG